MEEIWKNVIGYEGRYLVSNYGNVLSLERNGTKRHLCKKRIYNGYEKVALTTNTKPKLCPVHRLVAIAFIPNPNNKPQVNHIDGNKQNNYVSNLEWVSHKENIEHAYKNNLKKPWCYEIAQIQNGKIIKTYKNAVEASKQTGIYISSIYRSATTNRNAGGYKWKYVKKIK